MPLFRIVVGVFVLVVSAAVLAIVFSVLKAIVIVAVVGLAIGIAFSLSRRRHRGAPPVANAKSSSAIRRHE